MVGDFCAALALAIRAGMSAPAVKSCVGGGAVCACSTCHIYIEKGGDFLEELSDREEDFIDRAVNPRINSRLGCQCVIIDGDIEVTLPDQSDFMGH